MSDRTAIYARYSSRHQDDGTSIEVQLQQCHVHAGEQAREYIDRAVTGTIMDRPALAKLIADAEAGHIDTIYVYKYDRLGRSAYAHAVVADLEHLGVKVISATEGHDPLSRGIQLVVAEDYSRKMSERIRLGRAARFSEGKHLGGVPAFGYCVAGGRLEIDPEEGDAVRKAYEWYAGGNHSYRDISDRLVANGFKPRRARFWSPGMMAAFFKLPLYRGIRRYKGQEAYEDRLRIVSDDLYRRVRNRNKGRENLRKGAHSIRYFTRLLHCGFCGSTYIRRVAKNNQTGKLYPAQMVCGLRQYSGYAKCPDSALIDEQTLLGSINECFARVLADEVAIIEQTVDQTRKLMKPERKAQDRQRKEADKLDKEIDRIVSLVSSGKVGDADAAALLMDRVGELKRKRDAVQAEIERAKRGKHVLTDAVIRRQVKQEFDETRKRMKSASNPAEVNALLHDDIGPMLVDQNGQVDALNKCAGPLVRDERLLGSVVSAAFWAHWGAA